MTQTQDHRLTAESLYSLPDDDRPYELVRGHLVCEPRPTVLHGRVAARITYLLVSYIDDNPIGEVLTCDPGFILARAPDTVRGPDVALLLHQHYPLPDDEDAFISGAPDLAVEVLSTGDRAGAVAAKVADYLNAGAEYVWVVDPRQESVIVHRRDREPVTRTAEQKVALPNLLPGFSVTVAEFFRCSRQA